MIVESVVVGAVLVAVAAFLAVQSAHLAADEHSMLGEADTTEAARRRNYRLAGAAVGVVGIVLVVRGVVG
jgi:hypothetical protein